MSKGEVKAYLKEKLKEVAVYVCTVVADTVLLAIWLVGEYCFEHFLVPQFPVQTPVAIGALWIFRIGFAVSTLVPFISKIRMHIRIMWLRDSAAIKKVRDEADTMAEGKKKAVASARASNSQGEMLEKR